MVEIAQRHKNELGKIKKNIESSYQYFSDNYKNFHKSREFIFVSNLDDRDKNVLNEYNKPILQFNIVESYVSRLRGEFSKQIPEIEVAANEDNPADANTVVLVDAHLRYILNSADMVDVANMVYTDILTGGFSAIKVYTDYANNRSFNQTPIIKRVFDPSLVGFDPLARMPHKGDGRYCFECFPKTEEEFKEEFPGVDTKDLSFTRTANIESFNWSYINNFKKIIMVVDYFEKKVKKTKLLQLSNGMVVTQDEYESMKAFNFGAPAFQGAGLLPVVVKERKIDAPVIHRYTLAGNTVIEHEETDYTMLPLIFVDGNSVLVRNTNNSTLRQHTKPYFENAIGAQRLKNIAGQTLANHLEKLTQHKWIASIDSIPRDEAYQEAYIDPQRASVLVYNEFKDGDPNIRLSPPREVNPSQLPPEATNTFSGADQIIQNILGASDISLGITKSQLSGIALVESASQANPIAMPYINNYLSAIQRVAEIIVNLIPKYYVTPRSLPVMAKDGTKGYISINQQGAPDLNYSDNCLNVNIKAGYNFAVQKSKALQQITALMTASPQFAQFMTSSQGMKFLLDNVEMRGIDQMKIAFEQFSMQQQQQAAQQQQLDPQLIKAQAQMMQANTEAQQAQTNAQLTAASVAVDKQNSDNSRLRIMADIHNEGQQRLMQQERDQTERIGQAVDMAIKAADMSHKHHKDVLELNKDQNV